MFTNLKAILEFISIVVKVYQFMDYKVDELVLLAAAKKHRELRKKYAEETEHVIRAQVLKEIEDKYNQR